MNEEMFNAPGFADPTDPNAPWAQPIPDQPGTFDQRFQGIPPEALERFMEKYQQLNRPPMNDTQIPQDRPNAAEKGFRTPHLNPGGGTDVPFADPNWPTEFQAPSPGLYYDEAMDKNVRSPDPTIRQWADKLDSAEKMVQDMIHRNMIRKFR
jgi:hypothetical protein